MIPYYILELNNFDKSISNYTSNPISQIVCGFIDAPPETTYEKDLTNSYENFITYKLKIESLSRISGRAYGKIEPFDEFIKITSNTMFLNINNNILLLNTSKDEFNIFVSNFSKDIHSSKISFNKKELNFKNIIESSYSNGVQSIWFHEINDTRLRNEALYGNKLEASDRYKELIDSGAKISNMTISIPYNGSNKKIMLTKECGIILFTEKDFATKKEALDFIIYIYINIIKPNAF